MELLVPGLLLVALMVYASTRIKKKAAQALEEEVVQGDGFTIIKPEGLISLAYPENGLLFSAHTRDFGTGSASEVRHCRASVTLHRGVRLAEIRNKAVREKDLNITDDMTAEGAASFTGDRVITDKDGVRIKEFVKMVEGADGVFELRAAVIAEIEDDYLDMIRVLLRSLRAD